MDGGCNIERPTPNAQPPATSHLPRRSAALQREIGIRCANSDAFTVVELLGVMLILSILITMIVSVVGLIQRTSQHHRAETNANALVQAVLYYQQVYGAWPREASRTNALSLFVAGVGSSNNALFSAAGTGFPPAADIDQADVIAALAPDSPFNPRRILFLAASTNALRDGRLVDPWGHPYLLVMDAQRTIFPFASDLVFSNLPAFAISPGIPVAYPTVSNWIFSAGVRP